MRIVHRTVYGYFQHVSILQDGLQRRRSYPRDPDMYRADGVSHAYRVRIMWKSNRIVRDVRAYDTAASSGRNTGRYLLFRLQPMHEPVDIGFLLFLRRIHCGLPEVPSVSPYAAFFLGNVVVGIHDDIRRVVLRGAPFTLLHQMCLRSRILHRIVDVYHNAVVGRAQLHD